MKKIDIKKIISCFVITTFAITLNCLGAIVTTKTTFPLYMDSVFTFFITAAFGLGPGIFCAVSTNLFLFFISMEYLPFTLCHVSTAVISYFIFKNNQNEMDAFLYAGFFAALSNTVLGNIISDFVFESTTKRLQIDNLIQSLFLASKNLPFAINFSGFITNFADKMLSCLVSFGIFKIYKKIKTRVEAN